MLLIVGLNPLSDLTGLRFSISALDAFSWLLRALFCSDPASYGGKLSLFLCSVLLKRPCTYVALALSDSFGPLGDFSSNTLLISLAISN